MNRLSVAGARVLTSAAAHRSTVLREGDEKEKALLVSQMVSRVVLQTDALEIQISKGALATELLSDGGNGFDGEIALRAPCHFAKRGNEVRLVLHSGAQRPSPSPAVMRAVAQAKTWYQWIANGEVCTMRQLAKRAGLH